MHIDEFDFDLPEALIAQRPAERRDGSRLLSLDRATGEVVHGRFPDIVEQLHPEDVLVLNETRVVAARLRGRKERTGGRVEFLLLRRDDDGTWLALGRPLKGLQPQESVLLDGASCRIEVVGRDGDRVRLRLPEEAAPEGDPTGFGAVAAVTAQAGEIPLPPYIRALPDGLCAGPGIDRGADGGAALHRRTACRDRRPRYGHRPARAACGPGHLRARARRGSAAASPRGRILPP
jgi:S-adenosylmethionine:tRNA-ribosyltransferase-isomerase (queuine synthetase)